MTAEQYNDPHFPIDEEGKHDDLVIEDLPDPEAGDHDQLPSVEEYKAKNDVKSIGRTKKMRCLVFALVVLITLTVSGIIIGSINKKSTSSSNSSPGRTKLVEDFLFTNQVSTLPDLQNTSSPQHRATAFVADGDALQMQLIDDNAKRFVERYVLSLLYYHFNGPEWHHNLKFLSDRDHCEWNNDYETNAGKIVRQGVICDEDGHVLKLNLAWNNLKGNRMPREIGYLGELEILHMYYNHLGGHFPDSFRQMPNLKSISLMRTGLIGTLPAWIGELTQLTALGLGDNSMYGEIPDSIENLSNLKLLGLDGNGGFSGSMNKLKQLTSLEALYLESNQLSGNLQSFHWPNLIELDVSNNLLDESIPNELLNHPTLQVVDLNTNMLFGPFPEDMFQNTKLEYFSAHNSGISGTIPDRLAFISNLKHLDISFNGFTGTIPDTLVQLTDLHYLAMSGNNFSPQRMLDYSKMTNLLDLSLKNNNLIGTIPSWVGQLSNLQLLDLDANELTGSIPSWIGILQELDHLLLNRNKLTGSIPTQIQNMHQLQVLLIDGNSITGNAKALCDSANFSPSVFIADCYPGQNGERPEVECRCCSQCCTDDDPSCNDKEWTSNLDPVWEYGYVRPRYTFSLENAPMIYSKHSDVGIDDGLP